MRESEAPREHVPGQEETGPEAAPAGEPHEAPPPRRRRRGVWVLGGAAVALAVGAASTLYPAQDGGGPARSGAKLPTAKVVRTDLVSTTEVDGTLGYAGGRTVLAEGGGRITWLPDVGDVIERGDAVYAADGRPVPLFYGSTPFWRELKAGVPAGHDVLELERNLRALGHGSYLSVDEEFTAATAEAVKDWQEDLGAPESGAVAPGDAVVRAGRFRVSEVTAVPGAPARGAVLTGGSTRQRVTVDLPVTDLALAKVGAKVTVQLPGGESAAGRISSIGTVASAGDTNSRSQTGVGTRNATVPVHITLAEKSGTGNLDGAPATVGFAGTAREDVLAVPVNALLASATGAYRVKVVTAAGRVRTVPVELGVFEADLVEVKGDLTAGMRVQVPRS
ncbi:efflux RND transporter periplasmic adaptor subunit [Streptomyces sp. MAR4 CNX-425]|uniref:efflux RND transporter periplasmic adaptor subunit n=1 Tax=Streptomyces sp. MAR4 CNX-425 TaxID=3406343 RepID=UPI003B508F15